MEMKKITIVTPCYNSEKYIEQCILSIKNQTYTNIEHIIVDGGSCDSTLDIIKKYENTYNMQWISEKDEGMYDAITKGFKYATGDIYAWLNSDDMYMPWACELIATVMSKTGIEWCIGVPCVYTEKGIAHYIPRVMPVYPRNLIKRGYFDGRTSLFLQQESMFWKKRLWEENSNVINKYKMAGDFYLWKAFAKENKLYTIDSVISGFRMHDQQKSQDKNAYYDEIGDLSLLRKFIKKIKVIDIIRYISSLTTHSLIIKTHDLLK